MAYVTVPKDLTKVKSKVVFGLTKRQLICFGGALLVGVPLFFIYLGAASHAARVRHYGVRRRRGLSAGALKKTRRSPSKVVARPRSCRVLLHPAQGTPASPTMLTTPLCGNPKWKRRSTPHRPKSKRTKTSAKKTVKSPAPKRKKFELCPKYKGDGKAHSAQTSIPYEAMYQDGVCRCGPAPFPKALSLY